MPSASLSGFGSVFNAEGVGSSAKIEAEPSGNRPSLTPLPCAPNDKASTWAPDEVKTPRASPVALSAKFTCPGNDGLLSATN